LRLGEIKALQIPENALDNDSVCHCIHRNSSARPIERCVIRYHRNELCHPGNKSSALAFELDHWRQFGYGRCSIVAVPGNAPSKDYGSPCMLPVILHPVTFSIQEHRDFSSADGAAFIRSLKSDSAPTAKNSVKAGHAFRGTKKPGCRSNYSLSSDKPHTDGPQETVQCIPSDNIVRQAFWYHISDSYFECYPG
jgi:hypothetical protein